MATLARKCKPTPALAEAAAWLSHPAESRWRAPGWRELIEQWTNGSEWKEAR